MEKMRKVLGVLIVMLMVVLPVKAFTPIYYRHVTYRNCDQVLLDDGVYELTVNCQSNTGLNQNYRLDVLIKNDNVKCIYFDNGGSVHSGNNNSGYTWRGGGIEWSIDYFDGNILGGRAVIQVDYSDGRWQLFTIQF